MGSDHRQAHVELSLQVHSARFGARHGRRLGVHGRSGRKFLRARRTHGCQAVELSNRRGTPRIGDLVFGEWTPIRRDTNWVAAVHYRIAVGPAVPRPSVARRLSFGCVRASGGIEVRAALLLLVPVLGCAQNLQNVLKQGEQVFNKSCATGYCHGPKGIPAGAPRLAGRGFEQPYISAVTARRARGTAVPAFAGFLSPTDLTVAGAFGPTVTVV